MYPRMTRDEFIRRAQAIHGTKYDYSRVEYVNNKTKVKIICPVHGEFEQEPATHLQGKGCIKCGFAEMTKKLSRTNEQFIEEARRVHGDKYDYTKTRYVRKKDKVIITCPIHGDYEQTAHNHLRGAGCPVCAGELTKAKLTMTTEDFIRKARYEHDDLYDYSKTVYTGIFNEVTIICPEHGEFRQRPADHIKGHGCPKCSASLREKKIMAWLERHGIAYDFDSPLGDCQMNGTPMRFDFIIHGQNLVIEYHGEQHYKQGWYDSDALTSRQRRDQFKRKYCQEHSIRLEEIRYNEDWKQRLSDIFNINNIKV